MTLLIVYIKYIYKRERYRATPRAEYRTVTKKYFFKWCVTRQAVIKKVPLHRQFLS
jgi:hypothetical protein